MYRYVSDRGNVLLFLEVFYSFWLATLLFPISRGKQVCCSYQGFKKKKKKKEKKKKTTKLDVRLFLVHCVPSVAFYMVGQDLL